MNFRELNKENQIKAIDNVLSEYGADQLAYLIKEDNMDLYGWFSFKKSKEGLDYWSNLINKKDYEL